MKGHIQKRGKNSWRLKFDAGRDPDTGERDVQYHTFRGSKRDAQKKLAELIASVSTGTYVEPTKITVSAYVRERIDQWEAAGHITARTAEGYRYYLDNQIPMQIGGMPVQKLRPADVEKWHSTLLASGRADGKGGIEPQTVLHAHRVLSKALKDAARNVAALQPPPKVSGKKMVIVKDVHALSAALRNWRHGVVGQTALFTGMRRGEVLALRWGRVNLDDKVIQVREAREFTKAHGLRFKLPKTDAGTRDIRIPKILLEILRQYRKDQIEMRVRMGLGRLPDDALLFSEPDGRPISPNSFSSAWAHFATDAGLPGVTFHALRHTHVSQLIDKGVDIVTISNRLGHAKPDVTLRVYSHLFQKDDAKAAEAIDRAMA